MYKRHTLFIILNLVSVFTRAQDSVIPDVSYPYLDKLIAAAKTNYPRVANYADRAQLAKMNVSKARVSWFDLLTFSYIYQPSNTLNYTIPSNTTATSANRFLFNGIQLGLSLNLGTLIAKPFGVKAAKEELKIVTSEQSEYLITLTADVKRKYFTYLLQQNLVKIQTQAYQDIQASMKQAKHKFEKGESTFEAYNAVMLSSSLRIEQKLQAEANYLIAKSELEAVVGQKLEEID